jgi:hypothetical protein
MHGMTVAELYSVIAGGGNTTVIAILALPLALGLLSLVLKATGHQRGSQRVANFGIAVGLAAIAVEVLALVYVMDRHDVDPLSDVSIFILLAPLYLLVAGVAVEHVIHPGQQHALRRRIRGAVLTFIVVVVCYYVLGRLGFHMLVLTSITGFILFVLALIGILYLVARRFI